MINISGRVFLGACLLMAISDAVAAQSAQSALEPAAAEEEVLAISDVELLPDVAIVDQSDPGEVTLSESPCDACVPLSHDWFAPQKVYRRRASGTHWLPAGQDEMGWFGLRSDPYLDAKESFGVIGGLNIDWLDGPVQPDLPPRVYSLQMGLQLRDQLSPSFSYDLASSIGIFTDFEDSVRDGIQYPSHAVGFLHVDPQLDIVFGVDYLGRDDIKILPVMGLVLRDPSAKIRAELVFPRPKIAIQVDAVNSVFVQARLGGGSWDIEQPDESNDVFTYRDYSITVGWETLKEAGKSSAIEFGIVFDRRLEFRNSPSDHGLENAFVLRCVEYY